MGIGLDLPDEVYGFGSWLLWVLATRATAVVDETFAVGPARPSRHYGIVDGHPVPTPSLVAWLLTAAEADLPVYRLAQRDSRLYERQKVLRTIVSRAIGGEPRLFKDSWLLDLAAVCGLGQAELDLLYRCRGEEGYMVDPDALRAAIAKTLEARPAGNVELRGKYVAERDLTVTQYLQERGPIVTSLFQLPPDISDFTGRNLMRDEVLSLLRTDSEGTHAIVISSIAGAAGIGKTALAVHIAHKLASYYSDGQLYVDLRGAGDDRLDPLAVLGEFLRALGLEGRSIPDDMDERSRLYRAGLAYRRILVVLDNAASEAQVRPLLPGSASCGVIVTSRRRLAALAGSRIYSLDVLGQSEALDLVRKICGDDRVNEEPDAARQIVELCGCLPLAIRIAGARLAQRSHWRIGHLVDILANERKRLSALKVGDLEVRSSFSLSYDNEEGEVRRLFRLLGLIKTVDFAGWVAAPLLNCDQGTGEELVDRLVDAQLLDVTGRDAAGETRYRFHDLLRVYARERLAEEEPPESAATSERRLIAAYLRLAERSYMRQWPTGLRPEVRPSPRWP
jgi:hypothetical protein